MRLIPLLMLGLASLSLEAGEIVARVEMRAGMPRLVVNGEETAPRMFWGRSNGKRIPITSAWTHFAWKVTPHAPIARGRLSFRTEEGKGKLDIRNLVVTAPDGSARTIKAGAAIPFAAETTYTVAFDIRGEGVSWFRCGLEQLEDGVYHYHAEEVPWDDGELTSLVSESRQALAAGCTFVTFFTANCWREGKDDWGAYDAQFRQLMAIDPKIRLIPRVTVNAPVWWLKKHPECAMVFEDGKTNDYASVSSRLYRKEANAYLARLVRHLMVTFPENFAGIHFTGQNSAEWFYKDSASRFSGYDSCTREAFRAYLAQQGDPDAAQADVPSPEERHLMKDAPERFIDGRRRKRLLDFQRFRQIEMADTVGELAATCRAASEGKKLVMAFYGYSWELAGYAMTPGNSGHYGLMRLLEKWGGNFDVLSGPLSYSGRAPIGFAGVMSPAETLLRHGILWFDEDDLRVHAVDNRKEQARYGLTSDLTGDRQVMTRTVGMEVARGLGGWWMDLFGSGWYSDDGTWAIARELHAFERRMMGRPVRKPEVAAICDEESILNLDRQRGVCVPSSGCMNVARTSLAKAGVAFGQYLLEDALQKPLDVKVEFHLSTWKPLHLDELVRQVRTRPDVTRVWCWAPPAEATGFALKPIAETHAAVRATPGGLAAGLEASWETAPRKPLAPLLAAVDARPDEIWATWADGSAAIAVRRNRGGKGYSVFCGIPWITPRLVAAVCRLSGVHQYLPLDRVGKAVVWPGNGFVTVQSHEAATFAVETGFAGITRDALTGEILGRGPRVELAFKPAEVRILEEVACGAALCAFTQPKSFAIKVRADGDQGSAFATNVCSLSRTGALWMGAWKGKEPKDGYGFAELNWTNVALRDWSAFDRLAFTATNLSADEHQLVFYLYDGAHKKRQKARFAFSLKPRETRQIVARLNWKEIDADAKDIQALVFVHGSPRVSALAIGDLLLLKPGEEEPREPSSTAFAADVAAYLAVERKWNEALEAAEDEVERKRMEDFGTELKDARVRQSANLKAFRDRLAGEGWDVSGMIVAQASVMRQIRPRDTNFDRLEPANGISLRLAKGEYEAAQLAVAASGETPLKGVHVVAEGPLAKLLQVETPPVGYVLANAPLRHGLAFCEPCATNDCGYLRRFRETPLGWYADPILPFLKKVDVEAGDVQSFLVRVKAPENCPSGTVRGWLAVRAEGGLEKRVPIRVRVDSFEIGKVSALPLLVSFTPYVQPLSLSWSQEKAKKLWKDPEAPVNLWRRHREEWSDFLGEYFLLPSTIYPSCGDSIPDFDLIRRAAARGRKGPFIVAPWEMCRDEKSWRRRYLEPLKKRYAAACAAGLGEYAMTYGCDEIEAEFFPAVRRALDILKAEIPQVPIITTSVDPKLGVGSPLAKVDAFCPLTTNWDPQRVAASRAAGHKVWWYVACNETAPRANFFVESPLSEGRILMGAQALREKPDGFLYYAIAKWNKARPITSGPFTAWSPHGIRHRNQKALDGDGVLAYCGPDGTPLATLRLENFRDGVEDYNTAKLLERLLAHHADKTDAWAQEAKALLAVPRSVYASIWNFTDDPKQILAWRNRMADLIESETTVNNKGEAK